jgi:hypothetical protein
MRVKINSVTPTVLDIALMIPKLPESQRWSSHATHENGEACVLIQSNTEDTQNTADIGGEQAELEKRLSTLKSVCQVPSLMGMFFTPTKCCEVMAGDMPEVKNQSQAYDYGGSYGGKYGGTYNEVPRRFMEKILELSDLYDGGSGALKAPLFKVVDPTVFKTGDTVCAYDCINNRPGEELDTSHPFWLNSSILSKEQIQHRISSSSGPSGQLTRWIVIDRHTANLIKKNIWALQLKHGEDSLYVLSKKGRAHLGASGISAQKIVSYTRSVQSGSNSDSDSDDSDAEMKNVVRGCGTILFIVTVALKEHLEELVQQSIQKMLATVASSTQDNFAGAYLQLDKAHLGAVVSNDLHMNVEMSFEVYSNRPSMVSTVTGTKKKKKEPVTVDAKKGWW